MNVLRVVTQQLPALYALLPAVAMAEVHFPEFRGVPEQLADRGLVLDCDWTWVSLALIVVVLAFWANHFRGRKK